MGLTERDRPGTAEETADHKAAMVRVFEHTGLKLDQGKLDWHAFPLEALEGLIRVAMAGCVKYERFNCLKPFEDGDRRFFSAAIRHAVDCQIDPLSVDEETGCRHGYQSAWNMILRTYHAEQAAKVK